MDDAAFDDMLAKAVAAEGGAVRISYIMTDLAKIAPVWADEVTRPVAEAELERWASGSDDLRKGIGAAWLSRARGALAGAGRMAAQGAAAGARGVNHVENKVAEAGGRIGAAVGDATGGAQAARVGSKLEQHAQARMGSEGMPSGLAHKVGAAGGRSANAAQHARMGRVAARHAFRAGLIAGGAGTVGGAAYAMSGPSDQRVQKRAPIQLGQSWGLEKAADLPAYHNSNRTGGALLGAAGGLNLGAIGGAFHMAGHPSRGAGSILAGAGIGALAGGVGGFLAAHREHVEDNGGRPGLPLRVAGSVGGLARGAGRVAVTDPIHAVFGGRSALSQSLHDHRVRQAQQGFTKEKADLHEQHQAGTLSDKEHEERVTAARARWAKHSGA